MVLGTPERVLSLVTPASRGVDGQTSMLFGYASGAHALLNCTLSAKSPTRAAIVGTDARIEIDGDFYRPSSFTLIPRTGSRAASSRRTCRESACATRPTRSRAACEEGLLESPAMPLDESVSIMATMDQARAGAPAAAHDRG